MMFASALLSVLSTGGGFSGRTGLPAPAPVQLRGQRFPRLPVIEYDLLDFFVAFAFPLITRPRSPRDGNFLVLAADEDYGVGEYSVPASFDLDVLRLHVITPIQLALAVAVAICMALVAVAVSAMCLFGFLRGRIIGDREDTSEAPSLFFDRSDYQIGVNSPCLSIGVPLAVPVLLDVLAHTVSVPAQYIAVQLHAFCRAGVATVDNHWLLLVYAIIIPNLLRLSIEL